MFSRRKVNRILRCCSLVAILFRASLSLPLSAAEPAAEDRFRAGVWPLLEDSCLRCHGPEKQKGELRLDSREAALKGGKTGPALVPGKPGDSLLLRLVRHQDEDEDRKMPPKDDLSVAQIAILDQWIADGAPWPERSAVAKSTQPAEHIGDAWSDPRNPIVRIFDGKRLDLWSLKPIAKSAPPAVHDAGWVANPIDAFVLAKLEAAGMKPAPEANRRTLARRLYFDLTGLPPTPEEIAAFIADSSPDAYFKLVDKLLDSPSYGEHWGRMWLDVVRYGDSNGFDWDEFRPTAWRFRDYVIRSFNSDKPFDRFVREQLAGDEMLAGPPQNSEEQDCLIATGFLRIGPFDNSAKKFGETLQCRTQVMSDLVETTGAAFLGLNLSCCRCHNHKFDPLSQADYYRMRAFFEGVQARDDLPLNLASRQDEIKQQNELTDARIIKLSKELSDIIDPVIKSLREPRLAQLSDYDKTLLRLTFEEANLDTQLQIKKLRSSLQPKDPEVNAVLSEDARQARARLEAEIKELRKTRPTYDLGLLATDENATPAETHVLYQGDCKQPRETVAPGFFSALDPNPAQVNKPMRADSSGRRSALADWIVSRNNPLTARVLVNRVWQGHFGEGLQATPNDFGFAGARPTHPELLDWLAGEFMRQDWSLKKLHRLIVTSATYRQGPGGNVDGGKPLLAGQSPRRLGAEALRDSMLAVTGSLLHSEGGPPLWPALPEEIERANPSLNDYEVPLKLWQRSPAEKTNVRSIYLVQKRSVRLPMMEVFDLPENSTSCPRRNVSTVAPQALALLNNDFSFEMAKAFARRIDRDAGNNLDARIERAFALALQRSPNEEERERCRRFIEHRSLAELCRVMLNLDEFSYID